MASHAGVSLMSVKTDHFLDITAEVCPMTFVKTRLLIERMKPGETAEIRLSGGEPLDNVPDSVTELGHAVFDIARLDEGAGAGVFRILVRKN
jgi:TusA-related sulfurtransferase